MQPDMHQLIKPTVLRPRKRERGDQSASLRRSRMRVCIKLTAFLIDGSEKADLHLLETL